MNPDKCPNYFNGYRLISNANMIVATGTVKINIPLKQRLFSWPWRPFKAYIIETTYEPSHQVIKDDINMVMYMHPSVMNELIKAIELDNQ